MLQIFIVSNTLGLGISCVKCEGRLLIISGEWFTRMDSPRFLLGPAVDSEAQDSHSGPLAVKEMSQCLEPPACTDLPG